MKLKELADKIGAELRGNGEVEISGVKGMREAGKGDVTFVSDKKFFAELEKSSASAVIVPLDAPETAIPALKAKNPKLAFAKAIEILYVAPYAPCGISDRASIGRNARIGPDPCIHPYAVLADDARIGARTTLYPGVYVGRGSVIGDDCIIYPNVSIREETTIGSRVIIHSGTVIGSDGFGFVTEGGVHHKIPQMGGVIIEDDVELGANCAIDRATLGNTVIRRGTKFDNMVHVAHNVTIGEGCLIAGQTGIAGSSVIGSHVVFGGQVGVADHTKVGDGVMAGGKAVIVRDVEPGQIIAGFNAMPIKEWLRVQAILPRLPELKRLVNELERRLIKSDNNAD